MDGTEEVDVELSAAEAETEKHKEVFKAASKELTQGEAAAALGLALDVKRAAIAETEAAAKAEADDKAKREPNDYIGIETSGGAIEIVAAPKGWSMSSPTRTITRDGQNLEVVRVDEHGRWIFRAM